MNKEAIVVVLDAHSTMGNAFKDQTRFGLAVESIKLLLQQKLLFSSPNHEFGMVMFGTAETSNHLADKHAGDYKNVVTNRAISKIDQEFYRQLDTYTPEEELTSGDFVDGMVVALDMLDKHCGHRKYKKRVFLITDGESQTKTNNEELQSLVQQAND